MESLLKLLGLFALNAVKFFIGVPATIFAHYSFLETILISSSGGLAGFFAFYYFGELIKIIIFRFFPPREKPDKKKFTRKNRFIIAVKGKYGLIGLAILTPCLFSIPLGSLLAARFFDEDKRTIPYMSASILIWSLILTTFYYFIEPLF